MEILNYMTIIIPTASLILELFKFFISRKESAISDKEHKRNHQENIYGNNYVYEDNRKFEINNFSIEYQKFSKKQQNIDYIDKLFSNYSHYYVFFIYIFYLLDIMFPLPDLSRSVVDMNTDINSDTLLTYVASSFLKALLPTVVNLLLLIALICLALAFKQLLSSTGIKRMFFSFLYVTASILYFYCQTSIARITLEKVDLIRFNSMQINIQSIISTVFPFIFLFLVTPSAFAIVRNLITFLFESKDTLPDFKLVSYSLPRFWSYFFLLTFPISIIYIVEITNLI